LSLALTSYFDIVSSSLNQETKPMRLITALVFGMIASQSAEACFQGKPNPVLVTIDGMTVDLLKAEEGKRLKGSVMVARIVGTTTKGNESKAQNITLVRGKVEKTYRLAYPPVGRSSGDCNQAYISEDQRF
jgi:hypothetical protein